MFDSPKNHKGFLVYGGVVELYSLQVSTHNEMGASFPSMSFCVNTITRE
jgi:hypothetical protein